MNDASAQPPSRRGGLVIRPLGDDGLCVIKDPETGEYFHLGGEERFLLEQLDGERGAAEVCAAFEARFGEPLAREELEEFMEIAAAQSLLERAPADARAAGDGSAQGNADAPGPSARSTDDTQSPQSRGRTAQPSAVPPKKPRPRQSILYWRKSLLDPDRFFTWLAPKIRFFWTRGFLVVSAAAIVLASLILWTSSDLLLASATEAMRWETLVLAWLVVFAVGTLHEFAHGLTLKHHGGEVREIGFLLMYFMPCFYCNVSDAWLLREKSKRLWVTLAGGYFELFLWALAVFVWRVTLPGSLVHYVAFVVLSVSGVGSLFNFNPLLKLDGYYLLSDGLEIPNLKERANSYFQAQVRRLFWGSPRPEAEPRRRTLLVYGLLSWVYSVAFLSLMLFAMLRFLGTKWGVVGLGAVALLGFVSTRGLFKGFCAGEVGEMVRKRKKRRAIWLFIVAGVVALGFLEIDDRAGGSCLLRSAARVEVRAPVEGFIAAVNAESGERVSTGRCLVRLGISDLESRIAQKRAEVAESRARLGLLLAGPRPEEIAEGRARVERAERWCRLAEEDLRQAQVALREDLARLEHTIERSRAELEAAQGTHRREKALEAQGVLSQAACEKAELELRITREKCQAAMAEKNVCEARGARPAQAELARRKNELAKERGALRLLEAGTRPEEIEGERARLARLEEELRYLEETRERLEVTSPVPGVVTTERLRQKIGQYVRQGELLLVVEEPEQLEVEISLEEDAIERVCPGQSVTVKVRGFPYRQFATQVAQVAPVAQQETTEPMEAAARDLPSTIKIRCRLRTEEAMLRPGMTGYARISTGRRALGAVVSDRVLRFLRTEFWW